MNVRILRTIAVLVVLVLAGCGNENMTRQHYYLSFGSGPYYYVWTPQTPRDFPLRGYYGVPSWPGNRYDPGEKLTGGFLEWSPWPIWHGPWKLCDFTGGVQTTPGKAQHCLIVSGSLIDVLLEGAI